MAVRVYWRHQATDVLLPRMGELLIGRASEADVRIDDPMVSLRHARLRVDGVTVTIEDLSSRNGVFVNERRITTPTTLSSGDWVRVGRSEHSLRIEPTSIGGRPRATTMELRVMSAEDLLAATEFRGAETRADVAHLRPVDLVRESGRRWLADQGLPLLERFSSALYLADILSDVQATAEAQQLLGEAIDLLERGNTRGVLAPSLAARARARILRWFSEPTSRWSERLAVLAQAEGVSDRSSGRVSLSLALEADLRAALERGEITPHYQPIYDLRSGRVVAVEALARWNHATRGMVAPVKFIPVAEHAGLIHQLGEQVLRSACRQALAWRARVPDLRVCVNLSSHEFSRGDLVEGVERVLGETGLPAAALEIELTESMLMQDPQLAGAMMLHLRAIGIRLAIDDFGTGYSSLAYLHRFPMNALKIDRSFVVDLDEEGEATAIVRTIVTLAHSLGLEAIAEGVELPAQRDRLVSFNCDLVQGYLFARPSAGRDRGSPAPLSALAEPVTAFRLRSATGSMRTCWRLPPSSHPHGEAAPSPLCSSPRPPPRRRSCSSSSSR